MKLSLNRCLTHGFYDVLSLLCPHVNPFGRDDPTDAGQYLLVCFLLFINTGGHEGRKTEIDFRLSGRYLVKKVPVYVSVYFFVQMLRTKTLKAFCLDGYRTINNFIRRNWDLSSYQEHRSRNTLFLRDPGISIGGGTQYPARRTK